MFHDDFAKVFYKLINKKGTINIGGKRQSVLKFAKQNNKKIKKKISRDFFLDHSIDVKKFKKIVS